jgi:glycosyltransferase involved in cell wall biosynthesis
LFDRLAKAPGVRARIFHGDDIPGTKVRNATDLGGLDHVRLSTSVIRSGSRHFVWHTGLHRALADFRPHVILCEGESNFPNYLQVLLYRRHRPSVRTVHWSLGGLPGVPPREGLRAALRDRLQSQFDHFLVYSSYGRERMVARGHGAETVSVAVNTSDTERHLTASDALGLTRSEARARLGFPDRFTVLYCGAFEPAKRPDLVVELAADPAHAGIEFVGIGDGPLRESLAEGARQRGLSNVRFPGRVGTELPAYYRAADLLLVPGRGGMVISEGMAWSLPILVHQADGTEYDLVEHEATGARVESVDDFGTWIRRLAAAPDLAARWGRDGRRRLQGSFTTDAMAAAILEAVRRA